MALSVASLLEVAAGFSFVELFVGLALLAAAVAAALVTHGVIVKLLRKVSARTSAAVDDVLIARLAAPSRALLVLFAILTTLSALPLQPLLSAGIRRLTGLALIATFGWLLASAAGAAKNIIDARNDIGAKDNLRARQIRTRTSILHRIALALIGLLTGCLMLMTFPSVRHVGLTLFASAGIAGLVIGAAAQPALKNLIAGIQLAFTEPIRLDDVVIIDGEWGRIEEIRLTYVVVRIWDERRLVVPVSRFLEAPFQNWTRHTSDILGTAFFYLDYSVPVERLRTKLREIVEASPLWDGRVCGLQVTDLKERTVEVRALVSAADAGKAFDLRCEVRERMIAFLHDEFPAALPRLRADVDDRRRHALRTAAVIDPDGLLET